MTPLFWLSALIVFLVWMERHHPRVRTPNNDTIERWCRHLGLYFLGFGLHRLFAPFLYWIWQSRGEPTSASVTAVAAGFLAMDLLAYAVHRLHHSSTLLWRFHRVHHEDSRLDVATTFRAHPIQWISIAVLEVGLATLLKLPRESVLLHGMALPFFLAWHHAALDLPPALEKPLSRVLVTPAWHAVHHWVGEPKSEQRSDQRKNRHFAAIFSIWDRMRLPLPAAATALLIFAASGCSPQREDERTVEFAPAMLEEIRYGKDLIENTAKLLGPKGSMMQILGSRMTCQSCHLGAGTKPYGISLEAVHVRYPSYRAREGRVLTSADRINNCIERPLSGKPLPEKSREMRAIQAYFFSIAKGRPVAGIRPGDQLNDIVRFPTRAADPKRGAPLFEKHCIQCHKADGQGELDATKVQYVYPPLWGPESFQAGSNMNRITKMAGFIKANMPFGIATPEKPVLTDEEAFDVAAFVLDDRIHPRPKGRPSDFPKLDEKPIDYALGPYVDGKSELEHKFGPFPPIIENLRRRGLPASY